MTAATGWRAGLTMEQAARRLRRDGPNALPSPPRVHPVLVFGGQLVHFFAVMLWVAAGLALLGGMPVLALAIVVVVVLNGVFSFVQEYRADRAAERLRELLPVRATVRRDGTAHVVAATELVVDDVVLLEAGDRVSADLHAGEGARLSVDESLLTGESVPARRSAGDVIPAGTYVVEGHGEAVVVATGARTRLAGIAAATERASRPRSPLARQLHRVVRLIALIAIGVGGAFFLVLLGLGRTGAESLLFALGVTVALVPEGLLPTVTLSLARAAQRMAHRKALLRRLDAVETLGATTFICTDKTGTLTRNEMSVVEVWTPKGVVTVSGEGYRPEGRLSGTAAAIAATTALADSAARCSPDAYPAHEGGHWRPVGDPMEVALHVLAARAGGAAPPRPLRRHPFDPRRRRTSVVDIDGVHVTGAAEAVFAACVEVPPDAAAAVDDMTGRGMRVIAVAHRDEAAEHERARDAERGLRLRGVAGLEDPPRPDVAEAVTSCRRAGIKLAMVTGDHPGTAAAIATEVGLLGNDPVVVTGADLPDSDAALGGLLDRDGVVIARVTPEQKLRIARVLQQRGHVVAMTGDGVNDGPALRAADIGIAMGASGTDVAREAADLVLLDDHFGTIIAAVELGRATFANIRRFLTYHLTDNVAQLTPFLVWALFAGEIPLAIGVLQILALDIGTDLLPALALGAEPPNPRTLRSPARTGGLLDRCVLTRAFGVLGPAEALVAMTAFLLVLIEGGWTFGADANPALLATASGTAFTVIVLGQLANAFACRSETRWVGRVGFRGNGLLLIAVGFELLMLAFFLLVPPLPGLLGGSLPNALGWLLALLVIPAVWLADTGYKAIRASRRPLMGSHTSARGGTMESTRPMRSIRSVLPRKQPPAATARVPGVRRWAIVGLYGAAIVALALAPLLMPEGYSWIEHTTSHSGAQGLDGAWLARAGFLAFGLAVLASTVVSTWWGAVARAAHVAFGVSMVAVGVYSSRPSDPELPFVAAEDVLHSFFATAMGFAFAAGVVLTAYRRVRLGGRVTVLDVVAVVASVAIPLAMWSFGDIAGIAQRGMFAVAFAWYITGTLARRPEK